MGLSTKPMWGANRPRVKHRAIMAAASFSPAVAFRRAKYDGDFRVQTLLGAHPLDHKRALRQRATHNIDMAL